MKILTSLQIVLRRVLMVSALLLLAAFFYLRSGHFQRQMERYVVAALRDATACRVELDGFYYSVPTRTVYLRGLTLHGLEGPAQSPLFHADSVILGVRMLLLLEGQLELRTLRMERPHLHVVTDGQGVTNVPRPAVSDVRRSPLDPIFDLAIGKLEVVGGQLFWNELRRRLDFDVAGVTAFLSYNPGRDRYAGVLAAKAAGLDVGTLAFHTVVAVPRGARESSGRFTGEVRARFVVERRRLEVTELSFETPRSQFQGNGAVVDFRRPVVDLTYMVNLDLSEAERLLGPGPLRSGSILAKGSGHYEAIPGVLRAAGLARLEGATLDAVPGVFGSAHYELTGDTVVLVPLRLSAAGGEVDGRMRVEQLWESPRLSFTGKVQGLSVAALEGELARLGPGISPEKAHWTASLSGEVDLKASARGRDLELSGHLLANPPGVVPAGHMPVRGRSDFHYSAAANRVQLHDTFLETPGTRVGLEGVLAITTAGRPSAGFAGGGAQGRGNGLQVSLATANLAEWGSLLNLPVKPLGGAIQRERFSLAGAEFQGTVWGTLRAPTVEGNLRLEPFAYQGFQFDRFQGAIAYSPEYLKISSGRIERRASSAFVNASIPLRHGGISEDSPLSANVEIKGAELNDLRTLAGLSYPVRGVVVASLAASGTWRNPNIRGSVNVTKGAIYDEPFDQLRADIESADRLLKFTNLELERGRGRVSGFVNADLDRRSYTFQLEGNNLPLAEFQTLQSPRLSLAGAVDFRAGGRVEGQARLEAGQADLRIQNLFVNGELIGNLQADLHAGDDRLEFHARSEFQQARLEASGNVRLRGPYPLEGRASFTKVDWDPFLAPFLGGRITSHSRSDGVVTATGNLRQLESLNIAVELDRWQMGIGNVELHNQGPLRARYRGQTLSVEQARLVGTDADITFSGSAALGSRGGASPLALKADGKLDLAILHTLNPDVLASGQATMGATLSGSWSQPLLNGRVELREGQFGVGDFPNTLSRLNGALIFHNSRVQIENLTGESGGGQVRLSGLFDYGQSRPAGSFQLRAEANGVRVRYPPGVSTVFDADLALAGTTSRSILSGEVTVTRASLNRNFDLAVALAEIKQGTFSPSAQSWAQGVQLDVRVSSSPDIQFLSALTHNLQAEANLRLRGTPAEPGVVGRVNILEGEVAFAGSMYTIHRGEIAFINPFRIEPVLNLDVSVRKQQYEISFDFIGRLDKLRVNYRSDPPLAVSDIEMLLFVGRPPQTAAGPAAPQLPQIGANAVLSQALSSTSSSRLGRFFSGSVKVDPQVGGPENNPSARLTLEQQVSRNIRFTYITSLANAQQQTVQVEWAVNRLLSVVAVRDQNGFFGVDLKWKKRFR